MIERETDVTATIDADGRTWSGAVFGMLFEFEIGTDGRNRFPWCNGGLRAMFELEPSEIEQDGSKFFERVNPEDRQRLEQSLRESAGDMRSVQRRFRVELPRGGSRWIKSESIPMRMPDGATRWRGQMVDVTEQEKSESRWMRSARMLALVADASPDALFVAEPVESGKEISVALPYVSSGVGEVFGVEPRAAMEDAFAIWNLFEPEERARGLKAFLRAREQGQAIEELVFINAQGRRRVIRIGLKWAEGSEDAKPAWTGHAEVVQEPEQEPEQALEKAWADFGASQEGKFGASFLEGFAQALGHAVGASCSSVEWFDEPLLAHVEQGLDVAWGPRDVRVAILDDKRSPVGQAVFEWSGPAPKRVEPTLRRASELARAHWSARHQEWVAEAGLKAVLADLERAAGQASMGSLIGGIAHDLSSPLGNGALSIEVVRLRARKLNQLLSQDKIKKSELAALSEDLVEISGAALAEIDKARSLLDAFKKIAQEQMRGGRNKHELGALISDMRLSLQPTLRKRSVELQLVQAPGEIWARVEVAEMFGWLVKCAMASSMMDKGPFAQAARLELRLKFESGDAFLELALLAADVEKVSRELGAPLETDRAGTSVARFKVGHAMADWVDASELSAPHVQPTPRPLDAA